MHPCRDYCDLSQSETECIINIIITVIIIVLRIVPEFTALFLRLLKQLFIFALLSVRCRDKANMIFSSQGTLYKEHPVQHQYNRPDRWYKDSMPPVFIPGLLTDQLFRSKPAGRTFYGIAAVEVILLEKIRQVVIKYPDYLKVNCFQICSFKWKNQIL